MYGVYINLESSSSPQNILASFGLTSFVGGGTNANGSAHQIFACPLFLVYEQFGLTPARNSGRRIPAPGPCHSHRASTYLLPPKANSDILFSGSVCGAFHDQHFNRFAGAQ